MCRFLEHLVCDEQNLRSAILRMKKALERFKAMEEERRVRRLEQQYEKLERRRILTGETR